MGDCKNKQAFIDDANKAISKRYDECGDPAETYEFFKELEIDGKKVAPVVSNILEGDEAPDANIDGLLENLSEILINSGDDELVKQANRYLLYVNANVNKKFITEKHKTAALYDQVINVKWLLAITYKQLGHVDEAHEFIEAALPYAVDAQKQFGAVYATTELPLRRELAILDDDVKQFDKLVEDEPLYADNKKERFFTLRRCFEAYCFNDEAGKAKAIQNKLDEAFDAVKNEIEPVYGYAMKFDEFFYLWISGQTNAAENFYHEVYPEMRDKHFTRYADTLKQAHSDMLAGRHIASKRYAR